MLNIDHVYKCTVNVFFNEGTQCIVAFTIKVVDLVYVSKLSMVFRKRDYIEVYYWDFLLEKM